MVAAGRASRIPFLLISPYARVNYVDSKTGLTQASVIRFIEDNWLKGARIGGGSTDATTGSIMGHVRFQRIAAPDGILSRSEDGHGSRVAAGLIRRVSVRGVDWRRAPDRM